MNKISNSLKKHYSKTFEKHLNQLLKKLSYNGCIIFDDTFIKKKWIDKNDIMCWYYDIQKDIMSKESIF